LDQDNKIQWLRRQDAEEAAYPHNSAKDGESYVEIDFYDDKGGDGTLTKTFNHDKVTIPTLSSQEDFQKVYDSFVVKPYFRYMEIVEFVLNRKGVEKYKELSKWMGFEEELSFQEKMAKVVPLMDSKKKQLLYEAERLEESLVSLTEKSDANKTSLLAFCNDLLKGYEIPPADSKETPIGSKKELEEYIPKIGKLQVQMPLDKARKLATLSAVETSISAFFTENDLVDKIDGFQKALNDFLKEKHLAQNINAIELYDKAQDILSGVKEDYTQCPVCGTNWEKDKLLEHIKNELDLLKQAKELKEKISADAMEIKGYVRREKEAVERTLLKYGEGKTVVPALSFGEAEKYKTALEELEKFLAGNIFSQGSIKSSLTKEATKKSYRGEECRNQANNRREEKNRAFKRACSIERYHRKIKESKRALGAVTGGKKEARFF